MAKERTARKRAHKTEAREHLVAPVPVQEPAKHPDFETESEEATAVTTESESGE
jgi:hypothetical protein